jgi:hypothetical protein
MMKLIRNTLPWSRRVRASAFAVLCLFASVDGFATTLVALWTPQRILLAADSLVVSDSPQARDGCKIVHSGTTWLAVSGLVTDAVSGYELGPLARTTLEAPGTMQDKVLRFAGSVQDPLQRAVDSLKRESPAEYARLAAGRPVLQAIFASGETGRPVLATVGFIPGAGGALQPRMSLVDGSDALGPRLIYAGQQDRIREYLKSNRRWYERDGNELVRSLVQLEADAHTGLVGGPVDLVEIGGAGSQWIQKKAYCQ